MYIDSLTVRNLLSFGPTAQVLSGFNQMNLFIGPNGSGKSNVIRLLGNLSIDYHQIQAVSSRGFHQGEPPQNALLSTAQLGKGFISNRIPHSGYPLGVEDLVVPEYSGDLKIEYKGYQQIQSQGRIKFEKNFPKVLEFRNASHIRGHLSDWTGVLKPKIVTSEWDDFSFTRALNSNGDHFQDNGILIFGLRYIFQRDYIVGSGGYFDELHSIVTDWGRKGSGGGGFVRELWPDGVLRVAKIIQQLRRVSANVVLLEEPELGLEPRVMRRFVEFLLWLGMPQSDGAEFPKFLEDVENAWKLHVSDLQTSRKEPVKMGSRNPIQYFMTSHSSVMLSKILELNEVTSIYEFSSKWEDSSYYDAELNSDGVGALVTHKKGQLFEQTTLWSKVRKIQSSAHSTLIALGASGADLLQCNGVVWVEGPSDVIYIKAWLDMYAKEAGHEVLIQGQHFQFQMFGGTILDSLCLQDDPNLTDEHNSKLVEMFSFSHNAYVVIDGDAIKASDDMVIDKSNFSKAKEFIKGQFDELQIEGFQLGLWYPIGDIDLPTIESYLDDESLKIGRKLSKKTAAEKRTAFWTESRKRMLDFRNVHDEIAKLYNQILAWQPG